MNRVQKTIAMILAVILLSGLMALITYREMRMRELDGGRFCVAGKIFEISDYLDRYYVDEYDEQAIGDAAADAMIAATGDPWSYYISADDYRSYIEQMENAYVGIGVTILRTEDESGLMIASVLADGPSERAGIMVKDVLIAVDGTSCATLSMEACKTLVRGKPGTQVALTLQRGTEEYTVSVNRETIQVVVSTYELLSDEVAYIIIRNFDESCAVETASCIEQAVIDGAVGIVFDVRNNPGGKKTELVALLDMLLPEGVIFRSRDYRDEESTDHSNADCIPMPMAVLVNEDTYSAAEYFAAALQEYEWATVVGVQTSGKGSYQQTFPLSDGSAISISVGKYYTPHGESLVDRGVKPELEVQIPKEQRAAHYFGVLQPEDDLQLQTAVAALARKTP